MIERRGFLTGIFALGAAPAIVRAGSLMQCKGAPVLLNMPSHDELVRQYIKIAERHIYREFMNTPIRLIRPVFEYVEPVEISAADLEHIIGTRARYMEKMRRYQ